MSGLNFQDFNVDVVGSSSSPFTTNNTNSQSAQQSTTTSKTSGNMGDSSESGQPNAAKKPHFLTFGFYQQYFDVDTSQVQSRILHSFLPTKNANFITDHIQPMPDLYGPFWICVTLIFSIAIFGNFAHFIQYASASGSGYDNDFGLVTSAMTLIFCYVIFVPFAIYSFMWHRKTVVQYSYMEIVCAYGYSLAIFVPVSVLWVIELQSFRWLLIIVSVLGSGIVLVGSFWPVVKSDPNRMVALGFIAGVILLHTLLAVGFKQFYFDTSMPSSAADHSHVLRTTTEKAAFISSTAASLTPKAVGVKEDKSRIVARNASLDPLPQTPAISAPHTASKILLDNNNVTEYSSTSPNNFEPSSKAPLNIQKTTTGTSSPIPKSATELKTTTSKSAADQKIDDPKAKANPPFVNNKNVKE